MNQFDTNKNPGNSYSLPQQFLEQAHTLFVPKDKSRLPECYGGLMRWTISRKSAAALLRNKRWLQS